MNTAHYTASAALAALLALPVLASAEARAQDAPAAPAATTATVNADLYEALGAKSGIEHIVKDVLKIALQDPRIKRSFEDADLEDLEAKLNQQLCNVAGGPCEYKGKSMQESHQDLKIDSAQFNALVECLQTAMRNNGVPFRAQNKLLARLAPMQRDIITR